MTQLYKHQQSFIERLPNKCLLCWDTGTGKTIGSIMWANNHGARSLLVIVPKALKENWKRNLAEHFTGSEWTVLSKEEFRRDWTHVKKFNAVIVDEAHYFSGMKSQMHKNLLKYFGKYDIRLVILATATPYLSTPWNIYALASLLGYRWSYGKFRAHFFEEKYLYNRIFFKPRPNIQGEISDLVKKMGDVVHINECADIPDQTFETEFFKVNKKQESQKKLVKEFNPVVRFTKYHQIENGTLKGEEGYTEDQFFKCDKTERVIELAENHKKIAIVCRYNLQIDLYAKELEKLNRNVYIIQGKTKNRDEVVQKIEQADNAIVLINASCSEGYELPSVGVCVFASLSFSYKDYRQMLGRFLRLNRLKKNVYLHLITEDGVDAGVYDSIKNKEDFDIAIYSNQYA